MKLVNINGIKIQTTKSIKLTFSFTGPSRAVANTKINFDKPHDITFHVHFKNIIHKISISKMQSIGNTLHPHVYLRKDY